MNAMATIAPNRQASINRTNGKSTTMFTTRKVRITGRVVCSVPTVGKPSKELRVSLAPAVRPPSFRPTDLL